jgi:hypothetical protein
MKKIKQTKPQENIEYKFAIPPSGKIVTLKFLCETENGRLSFQNVAQKNVVTMTQKRFSYLLAFCLIEKKSA